MFITKIKDNNNSNNNESNNNGLFAVERTENSLNISKKKQSRGLQKD